MSLDLIKRLRQETGLSLGAIKEALDAAGADFESAKRWLRENLKAKFDGVKEAVEGSIGTYVHHNRQISAQVYLACQTDFTAKSQEFVQLANDIALHVASAKPRWISKEEVDAAALDQERSILKQQLKQEGRPENLHDKIIEGKLRAYYQENVLLEQVFVKGGDKTIGQLIKELSAKTGEAVAIKQIARLEVGR